MAKVKYNSYSINPSVIMMQGIVERSEPERTKSEEVNFIDKETGEEKTYYEIKGYGDKEVIDDTWRYNKLGRNTKFSKLTQQGLELLDYINENLTPNNDEIVLYYEDIVAKLNWGSKSSFYKGLYSLLDNEFLYVKTGVNVYYVNVNKIFNGDRRKLYKKFIKNDKLKEEREQIKATYLATPIG